MTKFLWLWFGQLISALGTGLTGFALGTWVYQQSGQVTDYALFTVATMLPAILVAPIAGAAVDRWNRKSVMIVADLAAAGAIGLAFFLWASGLLGSMSILGICVVLSVCEVFVFLAFSTSMTALVPKKHLGRANGMLQGGSGAAEIAAPALAGILVARWGLGPVLSADAASFLFAALVTLAVTFPRTKVGEESPVEPGRSFRSDLSFGFNYVVARPGLMALLLYFALMNFGTAFAVVLVTPMVLSQGTTEELGFVMSFAGLGVLAGSAVMSIWGGPAKKMGLILGCGALFSVIGLVAGLWSTPKVLAGCAFALMAIHPVLTSVSAVLWQTKVPAPLQGRVFAFRALVAQASTPPAYLLAGPLADYLFEPAMMPGGRFAEIFGPIFGTGAGRGMGLMLALFGLFPLLGTAAGLLSVRLRRLEVEIPDSVEVVG